jgi:hypothetical protein
MRSLIPLFAMAFASTSVVAAEVVPVAAFQSIELRGGGDLSLRPSPVQRVTLVEGSGQFTSVRVLSQGRLRIEACNARCPQHYRLRIVVESPTVPVLAVKGGGTIAAAPGFPSQRELVAAVGGGGAIDSRAVSVDDATAAVSGGGEIKLRARKALTAAVSGGGTVRYWGDPAVTTVIEGGGTVLRGG